MQNMGSSCVRTRRLLPVCPMSCETLQRSLFSAIASTLQVSPGMDCGESAGLGKGSGGNQAPPARPLPQRVADLELWKYPKEHIKENPDAGRCLMPVLIPAKAAALPHSGPARALGPARRARRCRDRVSPGIRTCGARATRTRVVTAFPREPGGAGELPTPVQGLRGRWGRRLHGDFAQGDVLERRKDLSFAIFPSAFSAETGWHSSETGWHSSAPDGSPPARGWGRLASIAAERWLRFAAAGGFGAAAALGPAGWSGGAAVAPAHAPWCGRRALPLPGALPQDGPTARQQRWCSQRPRQQQRQPSSRAPRCPGLPPGHRRFSSPWRATAERWEALGFGS